MFSKLIGRNKEIDNIKDVYKTDTPIWILGPPVIGKSTIINSFLNNTIGNRQEQWFCIDLYNMNWLSDTDIYNYFRDIFQLNMDTFTKDIVVLTFFLNMIIDKLVKLSDYSNCTKPVVWIRHADQLFTENTFLEFKFTHKPICKHLFWVFIKQLYTDNVCRIIFSTQDSIIGQRYHAPFNAIQVNIPYMTYTDTELYWNHLVKNKREINTSHKYTKDIYNMIGGDPVALEQYICNSRSIFENTQFMELNRIKKVMGSLYEVFYENAGIVKSRDLDDLDHQQEELLDRILKTNYIHVYKRKGLLYISLKPTLCYIISIEHQHNSSSSSYCSAT